MTDREKEELARFIKAALAEDVGDGDHTSQSTIPAGKTGTARLLIKEQGILAGVEEARAVLREVDNSLHVSVFIADGQPVQPGEIVLQVDGKIHSILIAERLLLNIMQRMSGIATATRRIVDRLAGTKTRILDTRKTTPLLRFLEKKAVRLGGGVNHRFGLYDMILIKDNHVDYAGGIGKALEAANQYRKSFGRPLAVEIEVRNLNELQEVMNVGGVDRVMLDNFTPVQLREALALIDGKCITEASGGITEENVRDYAETGVDYISIGALTHSVTSLDMSLKAKIVSCDS